jgi:hypothetical protein
MKSRRRERTVRAPPPGGFYERGAMIDRANRARTEAAISRANSSEAEPSVHSPALRDEIRRRRLEFAVETDP